MAWVIIGVVFVLAVMAMNLYRQKNGIGRQRNRNRNR
jgi:hypothetical protein